jgi:hypothetical protein
LSSRRRSLPCHAAGSAFVIALPLILSSRRCWFCIRCCVAAGSAFVVAPLLLSLLSYRCFPFCAAAAFLFAPPWNGGMAEWRNGGMAEWQNGGMAKWGMAE